MWISEKVVGLVAQLTDTSNDLKQELSAVRAERDLLKVELGILQSNFSWLCQKINGLEVERAQLLQKAYGLNVPVPEILFNPKTASPNSHPHSALPPSMNDFSFDDIGDAKAKELGLPLYGELN